MVFAVFFRKMKERNLEQCINSKFGAKLGKSVSETLDVLRVAYGDNALKKSSLSEWHKRFIEWRESVKDDRKPRKRKLNNVVKMQKESGN